MDEFSQILVHENSSYDQTGSSSDDDGQDRVLDRAKEKSIDKLLKSKIKNDKKYINMIRVQKALRYGIKVKFNGLNYTENIENNQPKQYDQE